MFLETLEVRPESHELPVVYGPGPSLLREFKATNLFLSFHFPKHFTSIFSSLYAIFTPIVFNGVLHVCNPYFSVAAISRVYVRLIVACRNHGDDGDNEENDDYWDSQTAELLSGA